MLVDPTKTLRSIERAERNIRFGVARGLTRIAKAASVDVNESMEKRFDRPTPFTRRAAAFLPAKRDNPVARVFVKDIQAGYLAIQEQGGVEMPEPGSPILLPVGQRTNVYGNIARGAIARLKARPDVFAVGRGERLPPGIYQRRRTGRGRARRVALKLLVAFHAVARYRPRFRFHETVFGLVKIRGARTLAESVRDALRTAR